MNKICHDYISYILLENPMIEDIILPHNQKINKYSFLQKTSQILPFIDKKQWKYPISFMCVYFYDGIFGGSQKFDNDMYRLCDIIDDKINEQKQNHDNNGKTSYGELLEILLKICILYQNTYLSKNEDSVTYKTTSFNIDNILQLIESKDNIQGIYFNGYNKIKKTYNFYSSIDNIIEKSCKGRRTNDNQKYILTIYFEILLIITNTYNNHIKELYCNEW